MSAAPRMSGREYRAAVSLASIFALRMVGLFMVLPVLAVYAEGLKGVTPTLVGLAIGVYGLTQALLQIPFGMASDRWGRKPVITAGLLLFAAGSVVAATADSIHGVILGRALQGAGAIASAVMALAADLSSEENRTKTMAFIGMSIGMSFIIAMVLGPALHGWIGVPGMFWLIAGLAVAGVVVLLAAVPHPEHVSIHSDTEPVPGQFGRVLRDGQLLRLDFGVLVLHMALTASFVVVPLALRDAGLVVDRHWLVYLPVMTLSMAVAIPFIIIAEKKHRMKEVFLGAIAVLGAAQLALAGAHGSVLVIALLLWVYFAAFSLLEATLPSLLSKTAPANAKGTAMGVYSSGQFMGAFIGGAAGGWLYGTGGFAAVFAFSATLIAIWLVFASSMRPPRYLVTRTIRVEAGKTEDVLRRLMGMEGVAEVAVEPAEGIAYVKVEDQRIDRDMLEAAARGA